MVVEVRSRMEATEPNQQRVEANILLLGAHNVGKTGEDFRCSLDVQGNISLRWKEMFS